MNWLKRFRRWKIDRKRLQAAEEKPVNVIQGIATAGKSPRNLERIKTCKAVMAELEARGIDRLDPDRYRSWAKELKRRTERLKDNDRRKD